jgi:hypothetical protein
MRWVWAHYGEVTLAQVGLGAVTIACGGGVLKRLRVARHATQAVMASWVMLLVGSGVWLATVHPLEDLGFAGAVFDVFWGLTAIGSMLMWSLLPVVALRFLRKPAVRHWFDERKAG